MLLRALILLFALAAPAAAKTDPRIDEDYAAFDAGDDAGAAALLDAAGAEATGDAARWEVDEARATFAHLGADDAAAVALLVPLLEQGTTLFGADSTRLIPALRMLGASYSYLDQPAEGSRMALRAARIARASADPDWLLPVLSDLARDRIDADDPACCPCCACRLRCSPRMSPT
jgi:hypothetical protein